MGQQKINLYEYKKIKIAPADLVPRVYIIERRCKWDQYGKHPERMTTQSCKILHYTADDCETLVFTIYRSSDGHILRIDDHLEQMSYIPNL